MALRDILTEGDPVLNRHARPVKQINEKTRLLIDDMLETMYSSEGVGLAAPQVGVLKRLFVMDVDDGQGPLVFVNPEIVESDGKQEGPEGCLSLPGLFGIVERPMKVTVRALDREGHAFEETFDHENDHLDGVLFRRHSRIPLCSLEELPVREEPEGVEA